MTRAPRRRAVVIGSGPNGLVAGIVLARAGLEVEVHEAEDTLGGGLRSAELTLPGFLHDVCAAVHPLALASPAFRDLALDVEWVHPPAAAAHPLEDGTAVLLERSLRETAAGLGVDDGAYRRVLAPLLAAWDALPPVVLGPYPPGLRQLLDLGRGLGSATGRSIRASLGSAEAFARSTFRTERARAFFAGHAAHSMLPLDRRPSAAFGLALILLGHAVGWPIARGGSARIADALAASLRALGGEIQVASRVDELPPADIVICDTAPRELVRLARGRLPARYERRLLRYRHGPGAFKLDWALAGPIRWSAQECRRAGTVHIGATLGEIAQSERASWEGRLAPRPFVLLSQPTLFDPTRAPAGRHTAWAYCHVPNGSAADATEAVEEQIERFAPGFRDLILGRSALGARALERHNRNFVGGDINVGAMDLGQLLFRPVARPVPYRTPLRGVFLCSAATPPGGGVHGMCGYGAARAALGTLDD